MAVTKETANYLVRRWYMQELGRIPKPREQADQAAVVVARGADAAYSGIYDSDEAKKFRRDTGRKI